MFMAVPCDAGLPSRLDETLRSTQVPSRLPRRTCGNRQRLRGDCGSQQRLLNGIRLAGDEHVGLARRFLDAAHRNVEILRLDFDADETAAEFDCGYASSAGA